MTTKSMFPRDNAGSFQVPSTKEGAIKLICEVPSRHLEIYTPHETFLMQTPDGIDPDRTNPNAMWVNAKTHDVGSASPIVASTFITAFEMLPRAGQLDKSARDDVLSLMYAIKETLLQCAHAKDAQQTELLKFQAKRLPQGTQAQAHAYFPVIHNLDGLVTAFLIAARRAVTEICQIPGHFF